MYLAEQDDYGNFKMHLAEQDDYDNVKMYLAEQDDYGNVFRQSLIAHAGSRVPSPAADEHKENALQDNRLGRRSFLATGATAGLGFALTSRSPAAETPATSPGTLREPARDVPIVERADVVVCGGGPAGVAAAISAARTGAKTRLIEVNGCLGGVWTAGLLANIIDYGNKRGIMQEILQRLDKRNARLHSSRYDIEKMKLVLDEMCLEAGVRIRLHTRVAGAVKDDQGRLAMVLTDSKSGREAFAGGIFVDASGDGDLGAVAGCGFDYGRPDTGEGQPMSFIVLLTGLDLEQAKPFVSSLPGDKNWGRSKRLLSETIRQGSGHGPSYAHPTLFYLGHGLYALMANHEYGVRGFNADEVTQATLRARREVHRMIDGLRSLGGIWKDLAICATPEQIGVRESRRIHGLYEVTADDLVRGARFDDAVCRSTFCVDIHSTNPDKDKGLGSDGVRAQPYDIPYRSLIARDVKGLLLAGRCISGDFFAHASYRVTGNSVQLGETAGAAAALAVHSSCLPQDVPWTQIRQRLESGPA